MSRPSDAGPDPALVRLLTSTIVLGIVAVAASAVLVGERPSALAIAATTVAVVVGEIPAVNVRFGGQTHSFTWSDAAVVAGLVLLPAWWLPIVGAVAIAASHHLLMRRDPMKTAFNTASFAAATFFATSLHEALSERLGESTSWIGLGAAGLLFSSWNFWTVSLAVSRSRSEPVWTVARPGLLLAALFGIANTSVAVLIALAATNEPAVLLAVPPLLVQMIFVYRNTREVVDERDLWVQVQQLAAEFQATPAPQLAEISVSRVRDLVAADQVEFVVVNTAGAERHRLVGEHLTVEDGNPESLADDVWGRLSCDRTPFVITRSNASPRQLLRLRADGIDAALAIPVEWGGELLGSLRIGFRNHEPSPRIQTVMATVASQLGSTIASNQQTARLRHQAHHDQLTELPNRTFLMAELKRRLAEARRGGASVGVLFFDLDSFKVVNDSLGHHHGDELLIEAARRLRAALRPGDAIARFGGDEFVVICSGLEAVDRVLEVSRRLLHSLETAASPSHPDPISASVGVAFSDDGGDDAESLLRDADAAMYQAKRLGAGSAQAFSAELREQVLERHHLQRDLREALDRDEIDVHFQPIVDLRTGAIRELEALARWHHPTRGAVSPAAFVAVAEDSGQIRRLGEVVLRRACTEMRRWLDLGLADQDLRVGVNLSARQVDDSLPRVVGETLARTGLPPTALVLEVTESRLVNDPDAAESLQRLRDLGVQVSLDDFGTGYSSLSALRRLPVDTVKIDRSFVRTITDFQSMAMIRGIVGIAHSLGLTVVAEGIEELEQCELAASTGCDLGQGWRFGRPMSAAVVDGALATNRWHAAAQPDVPAHPELRAVN